MRSLRFLAVLGLGLTPLLTAATAGTVPAFAGGGAGLTLTATMTGQDQRLLVGTRHEVIITVADTPGEADLRDIAVGLDDLDPHPLPLLCPAGVDGRLSLEPGQSLQCTAVVTAEVGYRTLVARARARVPGGGELSRSVPLHYTGFLPPPPPPVKHAALKAPTNSEPAAARPHPGLAAPIPADPPGGEEAQGCEVGGDAAKAGSGCCAAGGDAAKAAGGCCAAGGDAAKAASGCCAAGGDAAKAAGGCCAAGGDAAKAASGCCADSKAGAGASAASGCCSASGDAPRPASNCCGDPASGSDCRKATMASAGGSHDNGLLAFTGMSAPMFAMAGAGALALMTGGALIVRRGARR